MKAIFFNGSPRKHFNTAQLLEKAMEGAREAGAEAELVHLYDYEFTGCRSCFACKVKDSKTNGVCAVRDSIRPVIEKAQEADIIVIGSPVYYGYPTGQVRNLVERLLFPLDTYLVDEQGQRVKVPHKSVQTAMIYTMNMTEEQEKEYATAPLQLIDMYLSGCFGMPPETVHSNNTFQYNDRPQLNEHFRRAVEEKRRHHDEQFPIDLQNAYDAGKGLAERVKAVQEA